ncbi:MAG: hypothetical protein NVS9B12_13320 [Vulcanimicrobiaceae bacterium]
MWEAITATGSILSAVVIALTVVFASKQVKLGADQAKSTNAQLDHLRKSTQLQGAMKIFEEMDQPEFREAVRFVVHDLEDRMKDAQFRREASFPEACDDSVHKEMIVLRTFERVGAYVRQGLLDGGLLYTVVPTVILSTWEHLADVVAVQRAAISKLKAENFEYLYRGADKWAKAHEYEFSETISHASVRDDVGVGPQ